MSAGRRFRQHRRTVDGIGEATFEHDELWEEQPQTHVLPHRRSRLALSSPLLPVHALAQLRRVTAIFFSNSTPSIRVRVCSGVV